MRSSLLRQFQKPAVGQRSIAVEQLFHRSPPLVWIARFEWFLAGAALFPPLLSQCIGLHPLHIGLVVLSDIFKVGKQESILVVDRVVADAALVNHCQHARPHGSMEFFVFLVFFWKQADD